MRMTITGIDGDQCTICIFFIESKVLVFSDEEYILQDIIDKLRYNVMNKLYVGISDLLYLCGVEQNDFADNTYFRDYGWTIDDTYKWKIKSKPADDSRRKNIAIFPEFKRLFPDEV